MGALKAAAVFSDNMVIQRDKPVRVWGHTYSGRRVRVSFGGSEAVTECVHNEWSVTLPPVSSGRELVMEIDDGTEHITFSNIAAGEVWIAGGQSNMEFELQNDADAASMLASLKDLDIRFYYTKKNPYMDEFFYIDERNGGWAVPDGENEKYWSAAACFFAKRLITELDVPVGIIGCNWGGTSASAWVDERLLREDDVLRAYTDDCDRAMEGKSFEEYCRELDEYNAYVEQWQPKINEFYAKNPNGTWDDAQAYAGESRYPEPLGPKSPFRAGGLYKTMLSRVAPYGARGFLYYQGESDDHRPEMYERLLTLLIKNWRALWQDESLYFLDVQLPMHKWRQDENGFNWAVIREAQEKVCRTLPRAFTVCTLDCGEFDNIHPTHKEKVGERLALCALAEVYGKLDRSCSAAPRAVSCRLEGKDVTIDTENGVGLHSIGDAKGFEIEDEYGVFYPAKAVLSDNRVILSSDKTETPVSVRYQWINWGEVNVFGGNGLPLMPFRSAVSAE